MKRLKVILAATIVAAATSSALAIPTLIISDGVTSTSLTSASGIVNYSNPSFDSAWGLVITTGETKPAPGFGNALFPKFDLNVQAQSLTLAPVRNLTITFSENFFGPAINGMFQADLTGHVVSGTGQNVLYNTYYDAGNVTAATTTLLTTTGALPPPNYNPPTQFGGPVTQASYSLTQVITIGGAGNGPGGNYTLDATLSLVPEPSSFCLLLSSAAIVGIWRRRK